MAAPTEIGSGGRRDLGSALNPAPREPAPTSTRLRADLERQRRANLHRQIAALTTALLNWRKCRCKYHDQQFMRLMSKRRRLERELLQPMLITL